ncbi:RNA polymerase sigma factor [Kiloniella majae]|uniref:RNA polymerase sigma factor n=1 Tax=Kiloniella majae TaxID=1938558 RepID=UPI001C3FA7EC
MRIFGQKKSREIVRRGLAEIFPRLWRYCLVLTRNKDNANDLAQAACERALEKADKFETGTHLDRWIFRIAQRIWLNELRSQTVRRGGGLVSVDDVDLPDTKADIETNIYASQVLKEVYLLPEAQRITVLLVYVEGFSYKNAAQVLDIPIGTVMSRLAGARGRISQRMDREKTGTE